MMINVLSKVLYTVSKLRRHLYNVNFKQQHSVSVPVVSIGNLTLGGGGKTPLLLYLLEYFQSKGKKVAVSTRGYRSEFEKKGGLITSKTKTSVQEIGDESTLLKEKLVENSYLLIGRDRVQNLKKHFYDIKPDLVLLDDGYQHLKIQRDINLALFDATMELSKLDLFPKGYLREPVTALEEADMVIFTRADLVDVNHLKKFKEILQSFTFKKLKFASANYEFKGINQVKTNKFIPRDEIKFKKVALVCAVASSNSLVSFLEHNGFEVEKLYQFRDHHYFTPKEINRLLIEVTENGLPLICTEKDAVKIRELEIDQVIWSINMSFKFQENEEYLLNLINDKINS